MSILLDDLKLLLAHQSIEMPEDEFLKALTLFCELNKLAELVPVLCKEIDNRRTVSLADCAVVAVAIPAVGDEDLFPTLQS